jgi:hypothetical protein
MPIDVIDDLDATSFDAIMALVAIFNLSLPPVSAVSSVTPVLSQRRLIGFHREKIYVAPVLNCLPARRVRADRSIKTSARLSVCRLR